jgi:thioredoxin reductase (NADPH)
LRAIAFPKLDAEHMAGLGECVRTTKKRYSNGEKLVESGERDFKFFVVKSGEIEALDESGDQPKRIALLGPGEFTGDIGLLTGGASLVTVIARADSEVYAVSPENVRQIVNQHPDLGDVILQAFIARRQLLRESEDFTGARVIGSSYSQDTNRIRHFLGQNRVPFRFVDVEADPEVKKVLELFGATEQDTPVVAWGKRLVLRNPTNEELANALGIRRSPGKDVYDLAVVGAGPAGLAAAVYAASEGLSTVVLESTGPGGQAGRSMRIENYLGFPTGVTGGELADRATVQATKFGAHLSVPSPVTKLSLENHYPVLHLEDGETVTLKCLLIATGAEYRRLAAEGCQQYEGRGVYYAATPIEAPLCRGEDVVVVGGGNSAGQAAVYLAEHARKVFVVVRAQSLYKDMSSYLAQRIENTPNIEVLVHTRVRRILGDDHMRKVELENTRTGEAWMLETPVLFSFIGATPRTDWLPPEIERDAKQFVRTGSSVSASTHWTAKRSPYLLETSRAGVFAAGDVRSGSVKRVASAVGEGAMVVQFVHEVLASM